MCLFNNVCFLSYQYVIMCLSHWNLFWYCTRVTLLSPATSTCQRQIQYDVNVLSLTYLHMQRDPGSRQHRQNRALMRFPAPSNGSPRRCNFLTYLFFFDYVKTIHIYWVSTPVVATPIAAMESTFSSRCLFSAYYKNRWRSDLFSGCLSFIMYFFTSTYLIATIFPLTIPLLNNSRK